MPWGEIGVGTPDALTLGLAVLLVGVLIVLTRASFHFNSPAAVGMWVLTMAVTVNLFLGLVTLEVLWIVVGFNALAVGASAIYGARS